VLRDLSLSLYREDRVALVGVNGAGKTTLTRLLCSEMTPQRGRIAIGDRVSIGYYAQHQIEALNASATVYDEVASTTARSLLPRVRDILGVFRFHGDDVFKKIAVLSGGEKARVSLAKILLSPVNFLIMDEPTNHLDLASKEALEEALSEYDGTLLLISHDRYFLDKLVKRVWELADSTIHEYEGNYSEYLEKRQAAAVIEDADDSAAEEREATAGRKSKEQKRQEAAARQSISKERNRLKSMIDQAEQRIAWLEERKTEIETLLGQPDSYKDGDNAARLTREYSEVKVELEAKLAVWERTQLEYENLLEQLKT
jgi:ATP-binding cassette subfamily F protein 3